MITNFNKFKLNESNDDIEDIESELVEYLDDDFIDEYYNEYHKESIEDILPLMNIDSFFRYFDDDEFINEWIRDESDNDSAKNYSEKDKIDYIKEHLELDDDDELKIINYYIENNDLNIKTDYDGIVESITKNGDNTIVKIKDESNDITEYELESDHELLVKVGDNVTEDQILGKAIVDYDDAMLDELDDDQLWDIISDADDYEFFKEMANGKYKNRSAQDILQEFGYLELPTNSGKKYNYNSVAEYIYDKFSQYVDDDELIKDWNDNYDIDYKKEQIRNDIYRKTELQENILDDDTVLKLAELFSRKDGDNIGDEYDFQKKYIEQYVMENEDDDDRYETALLFLDDNFELDDDIKNEYPNNLRYIMAKDYDI